MRWLMRLLNLRPPVSAPPVSPTTDADVRQAEEETWGDWPRVHFVAARAHHLRTNNGFGEALARSFKDRP